MTSNYFLDTNWLTTDIAISEQMPGAINTPRPRQPWARLLKAVLDLADNRAELVSHMDNEWATATFSGSRHAVALCFRGAEAGVAGEAFIVALPDHEFTIPRYLVADARIVAVDDRQLPERRMLVEAELLLLDRA